MLTQDLLACPRIPDAHLAFPALAEQEFAVGTEGKIGDHIPRTFHRSDQLISLDIPNVNRVGTRK